MSKIQEIWFFPQPSWEKLIDSTQQAGSQKLKTQLRLFPGQTIENKYPSNGAFFSSQDQGQKMRYVW